MATLRRTGAANVGGRQVPVGDGRFARAVGLALTTPLGAGDSRYKTGGPEGPVDTVYLGRVPPRGPGSGGRLRPHAPAQPGLRAQLATAPVGRDGVVRSGAARAVPAPAGACASWPGSTSATAAGRRRCCCAIRDQPGPVSWPLRALCAGLGLSAALCAGPEPRLALALPLVYLLSLAIGSAAVGIRRRDRAALLLPLALATMHLSWGLGFFLPARRLRHSAALPPTPAER